MTKSRFIKKTKELVMAGYEIYGADQSKFLPKYQGKVVIVDALSFAESGLLNSLLSGIMPSAKFCPIVVLNELPRDIENLLFENALIVTCGEGGVVCNTTPGKCEIKLVSNNVSDIGLEYFIALENVIVCPGGLKINCNKRDRLISVSFYSQSLLEEFMQDFTRKTIELDKKFDVFSMVKIDGFCSPLIPSERICEFLLCNGAQKTTCYEEICRISDVVENGSVILYDQSESMLNAIVRFMEDY